MEVVDLKTKPAMQDEQKQKDLAEILEKIQGEKWDGFIMFGVSEGQFKMLGGHMNPPDLAMAAILVQSLALQAIGGAPMLERK